MSDLSALRQTRQSLAAPLRSANVAYGQSRHLLNQTREICHLALAGVERS